MIKLKNIGMEWVKEGSRSAAIDDIDLTIERGEFISIIGPSGCGKTTLLRIIAGLLKPTKGEVIYSNDDMDAHNTSIVFQNANLLAWRDVSQNVRISNEIKGTRNERNVQEKISLVGLNGFEKHYPHELSGGMQQRAAIARALVSNPSLLIMDEPFGSLDEINRNKLNAELLRICDELRCTAIFVTHSVEEAAFLSDRVVVLSDKPSKVKDIVIIPFSKPRKDPIRNKTEFVEVVNCLRRSLRK